jgi:methyl-accepting chemotaxis protein
VDNRFRPERQGRGRARSSGTSRVPIGAAAVAGVLGLLALGVLCIGVTVTYVLSVHHHEGQLDDQAVPFSSAIATASLAAKGVANDQRGFLLTGDRAFVDELDQRIAEARRAFNEATETAVGSDQTTAIRHAKHDFDRWTTSLRRELTTYRAGDRDAAINDALGPNRDLRKAYESWLGKAQSLANSAVAADTAAVDATSSRDVRLTLSVLAAALIGGCVMAWWLVRAIIVPLHSLVNIMGRAMASSPPA